MPIFNIYLNGVMELSLDTKESSMANISLGVPSHILEGELECSKMALTEEISDERNTFQVRSGDVITIKNQSYEKEVDIFTTDKKDELLKSFNDSNLGNPCKNHLHIGIGSSERCAIFNNGKNDLLFNFTWILNKDEIELSLGIYDNNGVEQWTSLLINQTEIVEIVYLVNRVKCMGSSLEF